LKAIAMGRETNKQRATRARELRIRLPAEKWEWLDSWISRGIARTYSDLILLAIDCFADKLLQRELQQARLSQLNTSVDGTEQ